jgi:L-asparaginase II
VLREVAGVKAGPPPISSKEMSSANLSDAPPAIVVRRRGGEVECVHRGWMVLVEDGRESAAGDPGVRVFTRSCTKPFQALAFLESGAADRFGCPPEEIALACASHDGAVEHRALAERMLARAGLAERDLQCGPSAPFGEGARRKFHEGRERAAPLVHNCSGKHAAFLLTQVHLGGDPRSYLSPQAPVQELVRRLVAKAMDVEREDLGCFVDGCSAPTFRPPLRSLAIGFARLANPDMAPREIQAPLERIRDAIAAHPDAYSGAGRLCSALLRASRGAILPKNGAEGVYAFGVRGRAAGFAVKIEDGATRGYTAAVLAAIRSRGFLSQEAFAELGHFGDPELRNTAGLSIGREELAHAL